MSKIQWTEKTWNPVAGCSLVSPGCTNCYAMRTAARLTAMGQAKYDGTTHKVNGKHVWTGKVNLIDDALNIPLKRQAPTTWFVNSMSDLFHEDVPTFFIQKVLRVVDQCPQHVFQVLTKRPPRMAEEMDRWVKGCGHPISPNLWLGVSAEDQRRYDERRHDLLRCPAAVRFLSLEPLLCPIDLGDGFWESGNRVDWVIVGGESGPGARTCDVLWIESIIEQCKAAGVPVFVKQLGANVMLGDVGDPHSWPVDNGPVNWENGRILLKDSKGGDMAEWPRHLQVREMPVVLVAN